MFTLIRWVNHLGKTRGERFQIWFLLFWAADCLLMLVVAANAGDPHSISAIPWHSIHVHVLEVLVGILLAGCPVIHMMTRGPGAAERRRNARYSRKLRRAYRRAGLDYWAGEYLPPDKWPS